MNVQTAINITNASALGNFYCSPKTGLYFQFRDMQIDDFENPDKPNEEK